MQADMLIKFAKLLKRNPASPSTGACEIQFSEGRFAYCFGACACVE
jgi:hypothetical protein